MIVLDMEMPKGCEWCPCAYHYWDMGSYSGDLRDFCQLIDEDDDYIEGYTDKRRENCPLREGIESDKDKAMERGAKKMSRYIYGMRLRGASPGAQPKEGLTEIQDGDGRYYNILAYERKLTRQEQTDYELDYIGEYDDED